MVESDIIYSVLDILNISIRIIFVIIYLYLLKQVLTRYLAKKTKLSLFFFVYILSGALIIILSFISETISFFSLGDESYFKLASLVQNALTANLFLCLFILANTFFLNKALKYEVTVFSYYTLIILFYIYSIFSYQSANSVFYLNLWVVTKSGITEYPYYVPFGILQFLGSILPTIITGYLALKFTLASRKHSHENLLNKRSYQSIAIGFWLFLYPFSVLPILIFGSPILVEFVSIGFTVMPSIAFIFMYIGFYKPKWFKSKYIKKTWISTVLN